MAGALEGIRVLDMGRVISAPMCSMILADMGAEVIKVEQPDCGDDCRTWSPVKNGESAYFAHFNRGKKGITLNLKTGKTAFLKMVSNVDILVENFRPGVMKKLGLGYEDLKAVNPRLIYASISGFGQNGPDCQRAGYDTIAQARSGLMSITGFPGNPPVRCGASIADIMAGLHATIGILSALQHRNRTGEGQYIDVSLTDAAVFAAASVFEVYLGSGKIVRRMGNGYEATAPGGGYHAKDGYVVFSCGNQKRYEKLCELMGRPDLVTHPDYLTESLRVKNRPALDRAIEEWTTTLSERELLDTLIGAGFACTHIATVDQVVKDPQVAEARNMFPTIHQPGFGELQVINQVAKLSGTPAGPQGAAPTLGQHNEQVYKGVFGFTEEELEQLRAARAI